MNISCETAKDLLPLFADRILSKDSERLIRIHLQNCEECKEYLKHIREASSLSAAHFPVPETDNYPAIAKKMRRQRRILRISSLAAACILCTGTAALVLFLRRKD